MVPAAHRLAAPSHSHIHYEETIYGISGVSIRFVKKILTGIFNGI